MLTLEIHDNDLVAQVTELLNRRFGGDAERMVAELLRLYSERLSRLDYSGRVHWPVDGLSYQQRARDEWG